MKKLSNVLILVSFLLFLLHLVNGFCCKDPSTGQWKCWGSGYCCDNYWQSTPCTGWIYGKVVDQNGLPIKDAEVRASCVNSTQCDSLVLGNYTDQDGEYYIFLNSGNYSVEAEKQYYSTSTKFAYVPSDKGVKVDFVLNSLWIDIEPNPQTQYANGEESTLTARLSDERAGVRITISTDLGVLRNSTYEGKSVSCYSGIDGSCSVYISSEKTGIATVVANAKGYKEGKTSVKFANPPEDYTIVKIFPSNKVMPGQNITVLVVWKHHLYMKGEDAKIMLYIDGNSWNSLECPFSGVRWSELGWNSSCGGRHKHDHCGTNGMWNCNEKGCTRYYKGYPITVSSFDGNATVNFTCTVPMLNPGVHTIKVQPEIFSEGEYLQQATAKIYVEAFNSKKIEEIVQKVFRFLARILFGF